MSRVAAMLGIVLAVVVGCEHEPPPTMDELLRDAGRLVQREQYDEALAVVTRVETLDPRSPRPVLVRGSIATARGDADAAATAYATAIDLALAQRLQLLAEAQQLITREGDPEQVADLREQAGTMLEVAARAAFGVVLADPDDERRQAEATRLWEQRLDELGKLPAEAVDERDLRAARLHLALTNALRGNTEAAVSQLDMLAAHHPDYALTAYWQQIIREARLRETLLRGAATSDRPDP